MSIEPDTFLHKWNAREFYYLICYLAWEGKAQRDYQEIMAAKARAK